MNSNETALRQNPTLPGELDRLFDILRAFERSDAQVQELTSRLAGPYPTRGEDASDKEPYGDMQRLQVLVDRLADRQIRIDDAIDHVRSALFGYQPETTTMDPSQGRIVGGSKDRY